MATNQEAPISTLTTDQVQEAPRLRLNLRGKMILGYSLIALFVAALTARGLYTNLRGQAQDEFQKRASSIAGLVALGQDAEQFNDLSPDNSGLYERFRQANLEFLNSTPEIERLLLLKRDEQGFIVVLDAADAASFGQRYIPGNTLEQNYTSMTAPTADSEITTTGTTPVLSGYAPLITSDGQRVGAVVVTLDASSIVQKQSEVFNASLLVLLFAVPLGIFFGYVIGNTLAGPIVRLTQGTQELATGQLEKRLDIATGDEVETLAQSFNSMADQLQSLVEGLESRVQERTQQLSDATRQAERRVVQMETVAQVGRTIATVRDLDQILPAITRVISQQFGFYHVGIFLIDDRQEYAFLRAANSTGGQKMLERGHKLRVEPTSIVGYAASLGTPRIALDVGSDAVFLQNPDLPGTRSELALPLTLLGRVIGVLDVQSVEPGAFTKEELSALNVLANQVATALENARLFSESRTALDDARKASRDLVGRDWSAHFRQLAKPGYKYDGTSVKALEIGLNPAQILEMQPGEPIITPDGSGSPKMLVPIKLRGEVIGVLNVEANASGRKWSREEITLAQAAAERAALALENARLVNEAQRRAAKERTIGEISGRLGSLIDIDNILQTAAQELGRTMPGTEVVIQFQSNEEGSAE
jgi:GAF domain-containing protein/HAMP domain-containing protein